MQVDQTVPNKNQKEQEIQDFELKRQQTKLQNDLFDIQLSKLYELEKQSNPGESQSYIAARKLFNIHTICRRLSGEMVSVHKIETLLTIIFSIQELNEDLDIYDSVAVHDILKQRFKMVEVLSQSFSLPVPQLLHYVSRKIYALITRCLIVNQFTLGLIEEFIGLEFFTKHILPQSWFYLLIDKTCPLNKEMIQKLLKLNCGMLGPLIKESDIKKYSFQCLAKIARTKQLKDESERRKVFLKMKQLFLMDDDFRTLYRSQFGDKPQKKGDLQSKKYLYESRVLEEIMTKLSMNKKHLFENLLNQQDQERVLVYWDSDMYQKMEFYGKANNDRNQGRGEKQVIEALTFLCKEIKESDNLVDSDTVITLLEYFSEISSNDGLLAKNDENKYGALTPQGSLLRINLVIQFIKMIELTFSKKICSSDNFKSALVFQAIYVLKIAIISEDLVEPAIFSLQILLNAIGIKDTMQYLDRFIAITTNALLLFPNRKKIKSYVKRIFQFYFRQKLQHSKDKLKDLQFVFLTAIQSSSMTEEAIQIIKEEIYQNEKQIAQSLIYHAQSLKNQSEDIKILGVKYILELIETRASKLEIFKEVRRILLQPHVTQRVYLHIAELKLDFETDEQVELSIICAKIVAALGIQQSFGTDERLLVATNQKTKSQKLEGNSELGGPTCINVNSDYLNPLTNQHGESGKQENILETLAISILGKIEVEREDVMKFAKQVYAFIHETTMMSEEQPKNYFYSLMLLTMTIGELQLDQLLKSKDNELAEIQDQIADLKNQLALDKKFEVAVVRTINNSGDNKKSCIDFSKASGAKEAQDIFIKFSLYLVDQLEHPQWRKVFFACIPALKAKEQIRNQLFPYLIYYTLRFNSPTNSDSEKVDLVEKISQFVNEVLNSAYSQFIDCVLRALDFLGVTMENDKRIVEKFIKEETNFRYVEKLYEIDIISLEDERDGKLDQNISKFVDILNKFPTTKYSFLLVKKVNRLKTQVNHESRVKAAQKINNFKRCIYNFEENYRNQLVHASGQDFLKISSTEEVLQIVDLYKKLNPQNFDTDFFNNILQSRLERPVQIMIDQDDDNKQYDQKEKERFEQICKELKANNKILDLESIRYLRRQFERQNKKKFNKLINQTHMIDYLNNSDWSALVSWLSNFNLFHIQGSFLTIDPNRTKNEDNFKMILCLLFAELYKGLQSMLKSDDTIEDKEFKISLRKIEHLMGLLYANYMLYIADDQQVEVGNDLRLFLHVVYEIDTSIRFIKDCLFREKDHFTQVLFDEINKEKRRFEKVYYGLQFDAPFEVLLTWMEERTSGLKYSSQSWSYALMLIYQVRKLIFASFEREDEQAICLLQIARLERKKPQPKILQVTKLFVECEKKKDKLISFELEQAKFIYKTQNAHEAFQYLSAQIKTVKEKCNMMYKKSRVVPWMPERVLEKCILFCLDLQVKIDIRNAKLLTQFNQFVKDHGKMKWEKPFFKYAQYLDALDQPAVGMTQSVQQQPDEDKKKRMIQKIFYYMKSILYGHKYIWQSLPRALQLWFDHKTDDQDDSKIQNYMQTQLTQISPFKIAAALQILLQRYGHPNQKVRDTILDVVAQLAVKYPGHCAWWIYHFIYFEEENKKNEKTSNKVGGANKGIVQNFQPAITRKQFGHQVINKISTKDKDAATKILQCEVLFFELKKLSEKQPSKNNDQNMDMPQKLQEFKMSHLVMPTEENLAVQIPPNEKSRSIISRHKHTSGLVITSGKLEDYNFFNSNVEDFQKEQEQDQSRAIIEEDKEPNEQDYPAYKKNPVTIASFQTKVTVMTSKEKPKKIGIIGSDGEIYNFLLKCDKMGDLRKEQRFIEFASLCKKMLENDTEARLRNLQLRTYSIVPLSRNTGLIEWIQNTATLKTIVAENWKKSNIKGEMTEIKKKAQDQGQGDTHTLIWDIVKQDVKPVLGSWFAEHFPSPEIWFEARMNFIKTTAIWSMIGYVIGLGDRHGDNILLHTHTGEVTHVDFDCIFEKGAKLRVPEIVPFRLTANIVHAFGIFKEKGVFQKSCEVVMRVLRENSLNIRSFLLTFEYDPLIESTTNLKVDMQQALATVNKKLNGTIQNNDSTASLSIEDQVQQVLLNAINDESLKNMYIGWMPWL